jgi:hypothetical protein
VAQPGWKAVLVAAAVLSGPAAAQAVPVGERALLSVRWVDPERALPFDDATLAADVRSLLGLAGVELAWTSGGPDRSTESSLRVVLLSAERAGASNVMGSVHRGSASRTTWISLPGVRRALRFPPGPSRSPGARRLLSRALARVICHELVHLVAPDLPHAPRGLMAPRLGPQFLTTPRVALSPAVVAALRAGADRSYQRVAGLEGWAGEMR